MCKYANVRQVQNCESKSDFIHKFKISAKEAEETEYGILLCKHSNNYPSDESLFTKLKEIRKIINKIIYTSKQTSYPFSTLIHRNIIKNI
ncbi:four helix bundle protein [Seramator thermalis]|uniref:four helix bundle protein n=1 Tax=Seramator thermalis TaxID=2496270 RepID=UPI003742ED40